MPSSAVTLPTGAETEAVEEDEDEVTALETAQAGTDAALNAASACSRVERWRRRRMQ